MTVTVQHVEHGVISGENDHEVEVTVYQLGLPPPPPPSSSSAAAAAASVSS